MPAAIWARSSLRGQAYRGHVELAPVFRERPGLAGPAASGQAQHKGSFEGTYSGGKQNRGHGTGHAAAAEGGSPSGQAAAKVARGHGGGR